MTILFFTFFGAGLLISGISVPLIKKRIPINNWYGVRLPNIMKDKDSWFETNHKAGIILFIFGILISLLSSVLYFIPSISEVAYSIIMSVITLIGTMFFLIKSIMIANNVAKQNKVQPREGKNTDTN